MFLYATWYGGSNKLDKIYIFQMLVVNAVSFHLIPIALFICCCCCCCCYCAVHSGKWKYIRKYIGVQNFEILVNLKLQTLHPLNRFEYCRMPFHVFVYSTHKQEV